MSKARITYRFENTRPANGQATQISGGATSVEGSTARAEPEKKSSSNVIPLKHIEFEVSDEPVVIEERNVQLPLTDADPKPAHPLTRRVGGNSRATGSVNSTYPYDYGAWNEPAEQEVDELERLIRATGSYAPAPTDTREPRRRLRDEEPEEQEEQEEQEEESGYWSPPASAASRRTSRRSQREEGPAWWKVAGSVVGAIATGLVFGTLVLNLFTGDPTDQTASDLLRTNQQGPVTDPGQGAPSGAAVSGNLDNVPQVAESVAASAIQLPNRRMFLLQNGMFETLDSARALAQEMKSKGLAATIEEGERFYVYAGVTSNRDAALRAGVKLQASGIEVYVKPFELPSVQEVRLASGITSDALSSYITTGSGLVQRIGDLTLVHLDGDQAVAPEAETLKTLKAEHLLLTEKSSQSVSGLPAEAQPMLKRMDDAVLNAVVAIEEYATHPDHAYLWSAQSALMDYIIAEKQLLTAIAVK